LVLLNYPPPPKNSAFIERKLLEMPGAIESWDLYLNSIEMGPTQNSNWRQFNVRYVFLHNQHRFFYLY
jgi:hypothetical protein